jgi:hypothetical protein
MDREIFNLSYLYEERAVKQTISFNLNQSPYDNRIGDKKHGQTHHVTFFLKNLLSTLSLSNFSYNEYRFGNRSRWF